MLKIFIPYAHAKNVYEISNDFFKKEGARYLLIDLDNTLDSYKTLTATDKAFALKEQLAKDNIEMIIVSNNTGERVSKYANSLGVRYFNSLGKPFAQHLNRILKENKINKNEVILIGDQTSTDIPCGNRAHIKTILTDKLVEEDQITTRFNRLFDIPRRKRLQKKNLLRDWRDL